MFFTAFEDFSFWQDPLRQKTPLFARFVGTQKSWTWKYLENILLLISINFTPKTSHGCLKRSYTKFFSGKQKTFLSQIRRWGPKRFKFRMPRKKNSLHLLVANSLSQRHPKFLGSIFQHNFQGVYIYRLRY